MLTYVNDCAKSSNQLKIPAKEGKLILLGRNMDRGIERWAGGVGEHKVREEIFLNMKKILGSDKEDVQRKKCAIINQIKHFTPNDGRFLNKWSVLNIVI